jgi:Fructose-bisphosphate aldolase class-II
MTDRHAALDLELMSALRAAVPVPLVLHGSSGVPDEELVRAVKADMTKINIATHLVRCSPTLFGRHWRPIHRWSTADATSAQLVMRSPPKQHGCCVCSEIFDDGIAV